VEETETSNENLGARISNLEQQVASVAQSTATLGAGTAQLGKKVASNTLAMDNANEFRTARNLDRGISEYRRI
jgi:cell division septum initiation protein DivIVA